MENQQRHYDKIVPFFKGKLNGRILDIGERNPLTILLGNLYSVNITNTTGDLDECEFTGFSYDTIICSHVIEHLFNPLFFLKEVKKVMNGKLYVITPIKPYWITMARCHFHEMDHRNFTRLIDRAGLHIVDWQEYSVPIPFRFSLRNWLRRLYKEYSIVTLTK